MNISFSELENYLSSKNIAVLDFGHSELKQLVALPHHHRDPFDRLIICQAITNNLTIITDDKKFNSYPVQLLDS